MGKASRIDVGVGNKISAQNLPSVPARNGSDQSGENESAKSAQILFMDSYRLTERVKDTLNQAVAHRRQPDNYIAECAGANPTSAKNWRQGRCVPNALQFLRLAATIPEVRALVRELLAMESDLDPMLEQKIGELTQYVMKR